MWSDRTAHQLIEPGDLDFWKSLWASPLFAELFNDPRTGYASLLERIAARPWWLITATHDYERRHFSTWFGHAIVKRDYANPLVQDLYYWHDLIHGMTFNERALEVDFIRWQQMMRANEIATSLETEVIIYWRAPHLRPHTFDHPIWHDTISPTLSARDLERLRAYFRTPPRNYPDTDPRLWSARINNWPLPYEFCPTRGLPSMHTLWHLRRAITQGPDPASKVEMDLAGYEGQAKAFYEAWRPFWREVEDTRARFREHCRLGEFKQAIALQLNEFDRTSNGDGVPYGDIAKTLGL